MKSIIHEGFANQNEMNIKGWDTILCDICQVTETLTKVKHVEDLRKEAKDKGWQVAGGPHTMDLCPKCKGNS